MTGERSTLENRLQYVRSNNDLKGVIIACGILILFILFWYHALFQINLTKTNWFDIIATFVSLEFLYTGLFITSHDAMHGAVCYQVSFGCIFSVTRDHLFCIIRISRKFYSSIDN
jgi:hypothetical protein